MKEFKTVSLADQVFEKLENDVIQGVYPPGEIFTELRLVEQLGVSRTPIREALRRLQAEHLIVDTGKGSMVRGITQEDVRDIMDIRLYLEGLTAFYATQNLTDEGREELSHIVDLMELYHQKQDSERLRQTDDEFHETICRLANRAVIIDTLIPLLRKTRRYRKISMQDPSRVEKTMVEHKNVYKAILSGDPEQARQVMALHIQNGKNHMLGAK